MLKKILYFSIFFCAKFMLSQTSLSGVVEYESEISVNKLNDYLSNKRATLDKSSLKQYDDIYLSSIKVNSTLFFTREECVFKIDKKIKRSKKINYRLIESWSGGTKTFYSNSKLRLNKIRNCKTLGDCFIISSEFKEWKLTQETKIISGYTCYKAIRTINGRKANKDIFAWYTPEIPVNFGPKGEAGLPGLILELVLGSITFRATKIKLNPKKKIVIQKLEEGIKVTEKEFKILVSKTADKVFGKKN